MWLPHQHHELQGMQKIHSVWNGPFSDQSISPDEARRRIKWWLISGSSVDEFDPAGQEIHVGLNPHDAPGDFTEHRGYDRCDGGVIGEVTILIKLWVFYN